MELYLLLKVDATGYHQIKQNKLNAEKYYIVTDFCIKSSLQIHQKYKYRLWTSIKGKERER